MPTAPSVPTATPTASTGTIDVVVRLLTDGEILPGDDSVAWLPGLRARPGDALTAEIRQHDKQFDPRVSIVPVGSTVNFPNYDRVFHNVFSLSAPKAFDLGLYRNGKSRSETFDRPGLVQVFCNIHPQMEASLMVVDSRIVAVADTHGVAHLTGVPAGTALVEVWNARAGRSSHEVAVPAGGRTRLEVETDISDWRPTAHLNKHGEEYPPPDDDDFRY
jgi:plastocyanin